MKRPTNYHDRTKMIDNIQRKYPPRQRSASPATVAAPPPSAERQAELERLLGLTPGDLDADKVDRRSRDEQNAKSRFLDTLYGVKK